MGGLSGSDKAGTGAPAVRPLAVLVAGLFSGACAAAHADGVTPAAVPEPATAGGEQPAAPRAASRDVVFDASYLFTGAGQKDIDLSRFEREGQIQAGSYRLEINVNGRWQGMEDIVFAEREPGASAQPCFKREQLERMGVDMDKAARGQSGSGEPNPMPDSLFCGELAQYVPGAKVSVDMAEQKLTLQVPTLFVHFATSSSFVGPEKWESGVSAAMLDYNANLYSSESRGTRNSSAYVGLNGGVNLGRWRLRHNGSLSWSSGRSGRYQSGSVYLQTDVPAWRSQLVLGETSSSGEQFDSLSFRGVQLSSDARMLPDNERNYAPVINGTARSNAKVSVSQRGYLIYETSVAPGAFAIRDLQVNSDGGDLLVKVVEADGAESSFVVPYASTPQLLRRDMQRYSLIAGQLKQPGVADDPFFVQAIYKRGLDGLWTAYTGAIASSDYASALLGMAANTRVGAFAVDLTRAQSRRPEGRRFHGNSLRLSFSKRLDATGTNFSLLAYRYTTSGFLSLTDAIAVKEQLRQQQPFDSVVRQRHRFDANISQQWGRGSLYANGSMQQFWGDSSKEINFSAGYGNSWRGVSYSLSVQRTRSLTQGLSAANGDRTTYLLNLSLPLGEGRRTPTLNSFVTRDSNSGLQATATVSGVMDEQGKVNYSVSASDAEQGGASGGAQLGYRLPYAQLNASVSAGQGYRQYSAGAAGALVAHPGGLTLSRSLGETIAVVRVPDAEGALVGSGQARVDGRGYAVVPSLTPYHLNTIDIDPKGMPLDVELKQTGSKGLAPRAGAVVMLSYDTEMARATLINSRLPDNKPLPFAATVRNRAGDSVGVVGQGGRILAKGLEPSGELSVSWGEAPEQQCRIDYQLPKRDDGRQQRYEVLDAPCQPRR